MRKNRTVSRNRLFFLAVPAIALLGLAVLLIPRPVGGRMLQGTVLAVGPAPQFSLRDQWGRLVSLRQFRGQTVAVTFLESHCAEQCPLVAEKLRLARDEVHRSGGRLQVIAISTDPENDTPHSIHKFSRAHGLLHTWHYLTGTRSQLEPIWNSYHVFAAPVDAPAVVRDGHTSATFLLDGGGNERVLLGGNPDATVLIRDLSILAGVSSSDGAARGGIAIGERAPDFSLRSVAGNEVRLRSLRGHPVILNFWATWCPPCAKEIPALSALYHRLKGKGVVVVGVNKQEDSADVRSFVTGRHVTYPVLLDSNGTVAGRYQLQSLPTTYIIDARGTIQASRYGVLDNDWLHRSLTILPTES